MSSVDPNSRPHAVETLDGPPRAARRWRISLRGMMAVVAVVAFLLWGGMAVRHYLSPGFSKAYYVGDLIPKTPLLDMTGVIVPLKSTVPQDVWWSGKRSVSPFFLSLSVIVRDSETGHAHVQAWLRQQRSRLKVK